jgi:hypothetical protein
MRSPWNFYYAYKFWSCGILPGSSKMSDNLIVTNRSTCVCDWIFFEYGIVYVNFSNRDCPIHIHFY